MSHDSWMWLFFGLKLHPSRRIQVRLDWAEDKDSPKKMYKLEFCCAVRTHQAGSSDSGLLDHCMHITPFNKAKKNGKRIDYGVQNFWSLHIDKSKSRSTTIMLFQCRLYYIEWLRSFKLYAVDLFCNTTGSELFNNYNFDISRILSIPLHPQTSRTIKTFVTNFWLHLRKCFMVTW